MKVCMRTSDVLSLSPVIADILLSYYSQGTGKWFEMQDLHVTEILPQMITLTEAYIQVGLGTNQNQFKQTKYRSCDYTSSSKKYQF